MARRSLLMAFLLSALVILTAVAFLPGCADDPVEPKGGSGKLWTTVDLGLDEGDLRLFSVAAGGGQVAALGWWETTGLAKDIAGASILFRLQPDGTWSHQSPAPGAVSMVWMDLALDDQGRLVMAGFQNPGSLEGGCVLDARSGTDTQHCLPILGFWTVDGDGGLFVAGGVSTGGSLMTSRSIGQWGEDPLPLTGRNDSGFRDVDVLGDRTVVCGYDDGSDILTVVLQRDGAGPWTHLTLPPDQFFGRTLRAIAQTADGAIFLGGISGAGGLNPTAFLMVRSAEGDWADIVLPDPAGLGGINDILLAQDGSIYLACSGEYDDSTAQIVRSSDTRINKEIASFTGQLWKLAQTADGTLYAAGWRSDQGPFNRPVLLRRDP